MTCWQGWKSRGSCSMWSPSLPLGWSYTELYKEDKQVWHGTAKSKWCLKKLFNNSLLLRKKTWLWSGGFTACFCVICNCYSRTAVRCLSWNWIWIWLWHWFPCWTYFMIAQFPISIKSILLLLCKQGDCDLISKALDSILCFNEQEITKSFMQRNLKIALW